MLPPNLQGKQAAVDYMRQNVLQYMTYNNGRHSNLQQKYKKLTVVHKNQRKF